MWGNLMDTAKYAMMQKIDYNRGRRGFVHLWTEETDKSLCGRKMDDYECVSSCDMPLNRVVVGLSVGVMSFSLICKRCFDKSQEQA